jgi:hypothetical protein
MPKFAPSLLLFLLEICGGIPKNYTIIRDPARLLRQMRYRFPFVYAFFLIEP